MLKISSNLVKMAVKKARQSECTYKVSAIGINKKGEVISSTTNKHRFQYKGGGLHAEMEIMKYSPPSLKTIVICRVSRTGNILPIHPCSVCQEKANELGVKIITIEKS
jgi:cytidine deaminase